MIDSLTIEWYCYNFDYWTHYPIVNSSQHQVTKQTDLSEQSKTGKLNDNLFNRLLSENKNNDENNDSVLDGQVQML